MSASDELAPVSLGAAPDDDPEKIRADIERARAQMTETIGAIQDKLRPEELKSQAAQQLHEVKEKLKRELIEQVDELKGKIKEEVRDAKDRLREATVGKVEHMVHNATDKVELAGESFVETVRANPIPAALVGIGVAWLLMNRKSARALPRAAARPYPDADEISGADYDPRYGRDDLRAGDEPGPIARLKERVGEGAHRAGDAVGGAVHDVGERAKGVAHKAQGAAHDLAERAKGAASKAQHAASDLAVKARGTADGLAVRARDGVTRAEGRVQTAYDTNPLALGAVALLAGLAVGLALPRTRREDRLMGQARDKLIIRAQEVAHQTIEKVQGSVDKKMANGVTYPGMSNHVNSA